MAHCCFKISVVCHMHSTPSFVPGIKLLFLSSKCGRGFPLNDLYSITFNQINCLFDSKLFPKKYNFNYNTLLIKYNRDVGGWL